MDSDTNLGRLFGSLNLNNATMDELEYLLAQVDLSSVNDVASR